jgi:hypothetical protein
MGSYLYGTEFSKSGQVFFWQTSIRQPAPRVKQIVVLIGIFVHISDFHFLLSALQENRALREWQDKGYTTG